MSRVRLGLGAAGVALAGFGVFRLLTGIGAVDLVWLAIWLVGALVLHDGMLAPLTVGIGALLARVPPRGRRYLQGALIAGSLVTVIAIPLIARAHSQPAIKAILRQNYVANLAILLAIVAAVALALYVRQVLRDRRTALANG